jgi:Lon protease-like protein
VVLFPRVPLPLHIFEPRYRKMVADAMASHRVIGMALLRPGWEIDYEGRPPIFPGGCAGRIERCEPLPDGRYNIVLQGLTRFRVREEHAGELYRLASVEALPDEIGDQAALDEARAHVLDLLSRTSSGSVIVVARPDVSHDLFVNTLCQTLALDTLEKQSLLDCDTVLGRYARLGSILEFRLLEKRFGRGRPAN